MRNLRSSTKPISVRTARACTSLAIALLAAGCLPAISQAAFGLNNFDVTFTNKDGTPATQAGSHPFAVTTTFGINFKGVGDDAVSEGRIRDVIAEFPTGFAADTTAYPRCTSVQFLTIGDSGPTCPLDTVLGIAGSSFNKPGNWQANPVYNLTPPPGAVLRLGFRVGNTENIIIDGAVSQNPPYKPVATTRNAPQILDVFGGKVQLWGNPSDPAHDDFRGKCGLQITELPPEDITGFEFENQSGETCPVEPRAKPFITLPTNCSAPLLTSYEAFSWEGDVNKGSALTHDAGGNPIPFSGCGALGFKPSLLVRPTTRAAQSPTGLDVDFEVKDEGLTSVDGLAQSQIKKVVLTFPEGMTANPSLAEGLEVCSEANLAKETLHSQPGAGCPEASKIGTVEAESPLIEAPVNGSLYIAKPFDNLAGDALIAAYFVLRNQELGVIVKQTTRVDPDPQTGRLIATTDDIPQFPLSHIRLHLREGGRSPLISPPKCGDFEAKAELTPWSGNPPITTTSSFKIQSGPQESSCPPGGILPFNPGFEAGSTNNAAGRYSPFSLRLTRKDGEQDMTKFSSVLPPGVLGKLAGISKCSEAQIARAKTKTGLAELANPSCPANSKIGNTEGGAGVGSQLTFVPGSLYLAGPLRGAPLSVVAITPAVAGPFDVGTIVVRVALNLNPKTGEVQADGSRSDPIPHILAGIPLNVRELFVAVDRQNFIINPTSCKVSSARATLFGSYIKPLDPSDDKPVDLSTRYQAAGCASLRFKPKLSIKLKGGGTSRGGHPGLRAVLKARKGDANIEGTVVRLPRSAFLDQAHIRTICTRVQFAAAGGNGAGCPKGAIYGHVRAFTPLLSEPLEGPIYLRSSNHNLPDIVFALHGLVDVEASARVDSKHGGIRTTFTDVPDAPIEKVIATFQGAKKGLIINSTDLCAKKHRADVRLTAQSGKRLEIRPVVQAKCGGGGKASRTRR